MKKQCKERTYETGMSSPFRTQTFARVSSCPGCPSAGDGYLLVNQQTLSFLDREGESPYHGMPVDQWLNDGSPSEEWNLVPGSGAYFIQNMNSGLYLDVQGASHDPGTPVIQYTLNNNTNQLWYITPVQ